MAFKILLTESQSAIGGAILKGFEGLSFSLITPDFDQACWSDTSFIEKYLADLRPAIVLNTRALSNRNNPSLWACDHVLPDACARKDLTLIHLSSHLVFSDSQQNGEVLSEQDEPCPDSTWGEHLLRVERSALGVKRGIVLRLPWLLDTAEGVIFKTAEALLASDQVHASDSHRGTPVFVEDVVRAVVAISQQILCGADNWGVFHFHSSDSCSEAEFADYISRVLYRKGCEVAKIDVQPGQKRLLEGNGWLVGHRCTNCFGIQFRSWRQGTKGRLEYWLEKKCAEGAIQPQARHASNGLSS